MIALRFMIVITLLTGLIYPMIVTGIAQVLFPEKANGSLIPNKAHHIIGSTLIAQPFESPGYFWPRPSSVNYQIPSGGSNLSPAYQSCWQNNRVMASGSGLDPHILTEDAMKQAERVANARSLPIIKIQALIKKQTESPDFNLLGEPRVNVLVLNLALDALQ